MAFCRYGVIQIGLPFKNWLAIQKSCVSTFQQMTNLLLLPIMTSHSNCGLQKAKPPIGFEQTVS